MKRKDIYVSLYILIPTIFSGITVMGVIIAYRLISYYLRAGIEPVEPMIWLVVGVAALTFACNLLILRLILKPIIKFVNTAKNLPIITEVPGTGDESSGSQNIEHINRVLDQVTMILGKVEARELFPEIVGQSRAIRETFGHIMKVAPTNSTVLIFGESGTGKELVATAIHGHSLRREKPLIKINCVAIPEGLLESDLFGHEKGAFTGAIAQKKGKFELADGGTIFLDEIGDMPLTTQAKLLRVLQEKEFERVGGKHSIRVDVRFVTATNKNLQDMVRTGAFREDLFFRINVFSLHLPPLRERREDIPFLIEHFLEQLEKPIPVSQKAVQLLLGYDWPGNIRELRNIIERAAVVADETIETIHLPQYFTGVITVSPGTAGTDDVRSLDDRLRDIEKGMIIEAMTRVKGIQVKAAQLLGINQRSLWHRIKKLEIDVDSLKRSDL